MAPGLYAIGDPGPASPILVTANYKLTFDRLRVELGGVDAWIAVLDTKGVNVWCAAGKGTFGTAELLEKMARLRLGDIVSHRTLILPQLGAPGVSAPEIARVSGFRVVWGPVRASDIPRFLADGMRKTGDMARVRFRLADRMAVAPVEKLAHAWPFALGAVAVSFLGALPRDAGFGHRLAWIAAATVGSVLALAGFPRPAADPPDEGLLREGAFLGALWGLACSLVGGLGIGLGAALVLSSAAVVSFIGLNFTGSSTFTCQPGANAEVEKSIIPIVASLVAGIGVGVFSRVFGLR